MAHDQNKQQDPAKRGMPEKAQEAFSAQIPLTGRKKTEDDFPVVALGASAGGLEAFEHFFTRLPPDSGMAFVLIQHLDPHHKSILGDLLKRYTRMKVMEAEEGMLLQPDMVFVIPPNCYLAVQHGKLHLLEPEHSAGPRTPIDYFFRSLAADRKEKAACIVFSGTGTEGALGLRAIKGEGGLAIVQDPKTAKFGGMPRNALATGLADYSLSPDKMPEHLIAYFNYAMTGASDCIRPSHPTQATLMEKVFFLICSRTGHDFTYYKQNTIVRRIERRMALNRITRLADYVRFLQEYPLEVDNLFKELLIGVTGFFRDTQAFKIIEEQVLPRLCKNRPASQPVRIWVPGCASGEEAYSLAILCRITLQKLEKKPRIQIFATDIDPAAIDFARMGLYPQSIANDVSPSWLERYFEQENSNCRVRKEVRDMVVFALQNVLSDPPFSRIDLVSCRNLLIYLGPDLQGRVLSLFHYSLNQQGFLFLGSSETPGELSDYFTVIDRKWKIFQKKGIITTGQLPLQVPVAVTTQHGAAAPVPPVNSLLPQGAIYRNVAERVILNEYGPTGVLIDEGNNILFIRGRAGKYLEPADGTFTGNILAMAREGLKLPLANAIHNAAAQKIWIRCENIAVKTNGGEQFINLVVRPIADPVSLKGLQLVVFEDVAKDLAVTEKGDAGIHQLDAATHSAAQTRISQLEQELQSNKEYLQTTVEELYSSNEELQSTNEELQTSKEELQSINEELTTVNFELEQKIEQLSQVSSDLSNLLSSTEIGTIFLDTELKIQRFTPAITQCINLIPGDIGRPISHISSNFTNYDRLVEDCMYVLRTLQLKEEEVQIGDDCCYIMRILPYRTLERKIDGVVVTFLDVSMRKKLEKQLQDSYTKLERQMDERTAALKEAEQARDFADNIIETVREPLVVLDENLYVINANRAFYHTFKVSPYQTENKYIYELGNGQWNIPALRMLLEKILPQKKAFNDFRVEHDFPGIGSRIMLLNGRRIISPEKENKPGLILLAIKDITDRAGGSPEV